MVTGLEEVEAGGVGLGLGGEIGLGHLFDGLALASLALGYGLQSDQGGAAEIDHIAAGVAKPDVFQERPVVGQHVGIGQQPAPHARPVQIVIPVRHGKLAVRRHDADTPAVRRRRSEDGLTRLAPVGEELIKTLVG